MSGSGRKEGRMPRLRHTVEQILAKPSGRPQTVEHCCGTLGLAERRVCRVLG
jgi:hypothetical protein